MNTAIDPRCAHPACTCTTTAGEAYCSEHCRKRVESPLSDQQEGCQCGHAQCAAARDEGQRMEQPRRVQPDPK
ncbi:hypothetical protein [Rhodanobacter sp. T12-5]|uniref:hypothetical protein n=1 Tax=Rhodanobacter sp. T12-5 TaxID=2024611 RepID=UPI0011F07373|nr:hypothetical protein [Rhodanobacter sp. T12-5]